ncbi:helix-turn-helix domain-containing protein [Mariniflexile jejuense]|uniref:Helix-turn-helix domain-containing protein n=1 Tax=Mariniflexile jejuense TaxID=1173582 RepID=A0ABW3JH28_9FLAO
MIISRQIFEFFNKPLIEKVIIEPPFRYEAIFQDEGCFLYIKSNTKIISANETITTTPKEAVLLKCGTYFVDWIKQFENKKIEVYAFHLYPNILHHLYQKEVPTSINNPKNNQQIKKISLNTAIENFIENLNFYFNNSFLVNDDLLELKIKELIILLTQSKNTDTIQLLFSELFTVNTISIKKIVETHLYSNISITELAKLSGLSLSSFKRAFKNIYNDTPNNYILNQKIQKATKLLQNPTLNISEIAFDLGFNDPAYFSRLFKNKTNLTPSQYRLSVL